MAREQLETATEFLREAVFRSRAQQAFTTSVRQALRPTAGNCGLGERAAVELDLSERARVLFDELFAVGSAVGSDRPQLLERVRAVMREWIERQDQLDRQRNHFLKAFRKAHGFDRSRYGAEQAREFEAGLAAINAEEDRARATAAETLLALRP